MPAATVILRSFGKMYGLAGLRLGFAISQAPIAARLRDALGPWATSGPGLHIGTAALADDQWLDAALRRLEEGQQRLDVLLSTSGCEIIGGTRLFRLISHPKAAYIADTLARHGIHVRRFYEPSSWLRFGLPPDGPAWTRLEHALREAKDA